MKINARITLILMMLAFLLFTLSCQKKEESEEISEQQRLVQQIESLNQELAGKEEDLRRVVTKYSKDDPETAREEITRLALTPEAEAFLSDKLQKEEGISYEEIIEQVMQKDRELSSLRQERDELLSRLPQPDTVEPGDNHYDLAMRFLIERQGLPPSDAQKLVERVALFDHLLPGFTVYHFYDGTDYGSSVLQGTATQSPNYIKERFVNQLTKERNEAIEMQKQLSMENHELEIRKSMLTSQIESLETEREQILQTLDQITLVSQEKDIMLSSLYYYPGSVSGLKEKGIIGVSIFGKPSLKNIDIIDKYQTLDLDMADRIIIEASELGIKKIQRIHILPDLFEQGKDYNINLAPDGSVFEISLLNKKRFKMEKIIIAVQ